MYLLRPGGLLLAIMLCLTGVRAEHRRMLYDGVQADGSQPEDVCR